MTTITGWNATMSIRLILEQLEGSYGKPDMMTIHQNDLLFQSPFHPSDTPEMLFYRIEQCQEIQTIAEDPYTPKQIISNAIRLLMESGIFPLKEFDTWDALPNKTYPILKTFVHEAYTRRLTSIQLSNMAGQQGYSEVYAAINQLSANQTTMMKQMAAMQFSPPPHARHTGQGKIHVPPIKQLNIPVPQACMGGSFQPGRGGGRG
jgi:hypothetical protein